MAGWLTVAGQAGASPATRSARGVSWMSADATGDERRWVADKRDFVADSRDDAADSRESVADAREASADAWETALDEWEDALGSRATRLGMDDPSAAAERAAAREAREAARHERDRAREERRLARVHREDAAGRRLDGAPPTLLALAFAGIAEHLYNADDYDEVLARIAEAAVETVVGARFASVTLAADGGYRSAGSTAAAATAVDQEQYDADEGPSLDALTTPVVDAPGFPDDRWPVLAARPTDHGVQSALSYQLTGSTGEPGTGSGSLNVYASAPAAFDQEAREIGLILASHAALAARAVGERASLQGLGQQLEHALLSRDVIGQAKGILMERLKTTPEDAFDILRNSSQRLNLKLREVARRLTETGEVDAGDLPGR